MSKKRSEIIKEFCDAIQMPAEATEQIIRDEKKETDPARIFELFYAQKGEKTAFYQAIEEGTGAKKTGAERECIYRRYLLYYTLLGIKAEKIFQKKGCKTSEYRETMEDIALWCGKCRQKYGMYGIYQHDWLWRHAEGSLVRLGRLQYEEMESLWDLQSEDIQIKKGDPVINIHIPEGAPLLREQCCRSAERAREKFGEKIPMICHSWLLSPTLRDLLGPDSNILQFQDLFVVVRTNSDEREAEERLYGELKEQYAEYPAETTLQKAARKYLITGGKIGTGIGIYR